MFGPRSHKENSSNIPTFPAETGEHGRIQHERVEDIQSIQDAKAEGRIAELERALAVAKEDQAALREELDNSKRRSQVYGEPGADYRRPVPRPSSPLPGSTRVDYSSLETSPRRPISRAREDVMEQNFALRGQVAHLHEQLVQQDAMFRSNLEQRVQSRDAEWEEVTARLHHTEKESQERLQQLLDLKHSISAMTRMENQATDSELAERADQLYHRIREWVISNFRRAKLDFANVSRDTTKVLEAIHPQYATVSSSDRLPLYQALIANALMDIFREDICIGLPTSGPLAPMRQLAAYIHNAGNEYREWRRATIRALEKSESRHALREERERMLHRVAADVEHQLFSLTSTNLTPNAQASLLAILDSAADLQHILLLQKAQYRLQFFCNDEYDEVCYDEECMEAVNDGMDEDGDMALGRRFAFCVFPCLEKFGDEFGEKVEVRNVLLRARVCSGVG